MAQQESVLIVGGGILQRPAIRAARELGYRAIVTDGDASCCGAALADDFYPIDIYNVIAHAELAVYLESTERLQAVFTAAADPVETVAVAAQAAGLHHAPLSVAHTCADKIRTRMALDSWPDIQPSWLVVAPSALEVAVREVFGGQAIIKAARGSGGRGHVKVRSPEEAAEQAPRWNHRLTVLVEELLEGLELSAEAVWHDGCMWPLNAVERPFAHDPSKLTRHGDEDVLRESTGKIEGGWRRAIQVGDQYAVELGHYNPAMLERRQWEGVWSVVEKCGEAIGLVDAPGAHVHKCDLILTAEGPKVLETTIRLSGNWDSGMTSPLAHGVDYTKAALVMAAGGAPDWSLLSPRWKRHAVCLFKFAEPGSVVGATYQGVPIFPAARGGVRTDEQVHVIPRYQPGNVVPPLESYATLAGWVVGEGATRPRAFARAYRALHALAYQTEVV